MAIIKFGLPAHKILGYTGVWVGETKIASIGIAVKNWISYHGFAMNVNNDLNFFRLIHPCGIRDRKMSSISSLLKTKISIEEVKKEVILSFKEIFS